MSRTDQYTRRGSSIAGAYPSGSAHCPGGGRAAVRLAAGGHHDPRDGGKAATPNLPYRYITQRQVESDRPHLLPKRVVRLLLTRLNSELPLGSSMPG